VQYERPSPRVAFGDAMPFFDGERLHVYYLPAIHRPDGALEGHDWAHLSSADLTTWREHPPALTRDEVHSSFGTGSVFVRDGRYYAFYSASRRGQPYSVIGMKEGETPDRFQEVEAARFPGPDERTAQGYQLHHYRDPCVFQDAATGRFHLLFTGARNNLVQGTIYPFGGCVGHMTSDDFLHWTLREPFHVTGRKGAPECPDFFQWGDWYYLTFSNDGCTHYVRSRDILGPWRIPDQPQLTTAQERVMKFAAFHGGRRIGVAFAPQMRPEGPLYGGRAVFRELIQRPDGTLAVTVPPECRLPDTQRRFGPRTAALSISGGVQTFSLGPLPGNHTLRMRVEPASNGEEYGLLLKGKPFGEALELAFMPRQNRLELRDDMKRWPCTNDYTINHVRAHVDLTRPFGLSVVVRDDLIDVEIDGRQCFLSTFPPLANEGHAFAFAANAAVTFRGIEAWSND